MNHLALPPMGQLQFCLGLFLIFLTVLFSLHIMCVCVLVCDLGAAGQASKRVQGVGWDSRPMKGKVGNFGGVSHCALLY